MAEIYLGIYKIKQIHVVEKCWNLCGWGWETNEKQTKQYLYTSFTAEDLFNVKKKNTNIHTIWDQYIGTSHFIKVVQ